MPFSNELAAAAGITPTPDPKSTPPPFLNNGIGNQFNKSAAQPPKTLEELAQARLLKGLEKGMQLYTEHEQIKPYSYNAGKDSNAFYKRYHAFGQETFDEIGFSPFEDNDAKFNAQTSYMDRLSRTWTHGFKPLFARGFVSGPKSLGRMLQGDFGDDPEDATKYAEAAAISQDTKGGVGSFFNNSLMNFGYTAGIMSEAILEELGALALAPETGGVSAVVGTANFGRRIGQALKGIKGVAGVIDMAKTINTSLRSLNNINKAREFFSAARIEKALATKMGRVGKFLNPAENLLETGLDIAKNSKQLQGWSRFNNGVYKTAGALYRDVRNINMALSEARLEGGFQRNDTFEKLYNDYRAANNGEAPSDLIQDTMRQEAAKASSDVMLANTLLIYTSNKVSFGNIVSPKTGLAKMMFKKMADVKKMATGRTVKEFTKTTLKSGKEILTPKLSYIKKGWKGWKGTLQAVKKRGVQATVKGVIGYTKANLMEGVQESLQDVISETSKNYHLQSFYSEAVGSYLYSAGQVEQMKKKQREEKGLGEMVGEALGKQVSWQGLETFGSGFAMGTFAHPVNQALPFLQQKYQQIFKKEEYKAFKEQTNNYAERMAKSVSDTFKGDPLKFFNTKVFGLGDQTELSNVINGSDQKEQRDAANESAIKQVTDVIESDSMDTWTEYMESLKELTTEEYAEAVGITVEEAQGHTEKLDKIINRAKDIETEYKKYNDRLPNPIDLGNYEKGTKEYEKASVYYKAWEEGKKSIVFYNESYKDTMMRMQGVFQDIGSEQLLGKIDPNRVQALLKDDRLEGEIQILESEIEGLTGLTDPISKKRLTESKGTLSNLKEFRDNYNNFMSHFFEGAEVKDTGEAEFLQKQIAVINTEMSQTKNKTDRELLKVKLDNLQKRADGIKLSDEKAAGKQAIQSKKSQVKDIEAKIDELKDRKQKLSSPEYYEAYAKDKTYAEKESRNIDAQIAKLNKEKDAVSEGLTNDTEFENEQVMNKLEASFKKYMKSLAKQSDDVILDDKIDDAFEKLVDYYRLGRESGKLSDAVNMLTDPAGFIDHVERTYDWMYDMWNNREDLIKQNINMQLQRLKYNELLNNMAAKGIYVDLDEFAYYKETGVIPSEFFDDINKRVIAVGSPIYEQIANEFSKLSLLQQLSDTMKTDSQKLDEEINRLNMEEQDEIDKLPTVQTRVKVRSIDNTNNFSVAVLNDQVSAGQYVEAAYEEDGTQKKQIFFKDTAGVLRYDDVNGEIIDTEMKTVFTSGEIFELLQLPAQIEVDEIKKRYAELRAEAAEKSIEDTSKPFTPAEQVELDEITADTPVEAMPEELRIALIDAYEKYRTDPANKNLFPDTLSEDDLNEKFKLYIKSEPEALEIIENFIKEQKLKGAITPAGEVVVPTITLPNGDTISADEATDAMLDAVLKNYRLLIADLSAKSPANLSDVEREDLAKFKAKANVLSTYLENKRVGELSPELRLAKARIDLLLKEQARITPKETGYLIDDELLRRVSNVIQGLKGSKYEYTEINEVRALYNMTLGNGGTVDDFITALRGAKLKGFSEFTYTELKKELDEFVANSKNNTAATELLNNYNKRVADITANYAKRIREVGKARYRNNLEEARDKELLKLKEEYEAELAALEQKPVAEKPVSYDGLLSKTNVDIANNPVGAKLSYRFFANLLEAVNSGAIKSKQELNAIIAEWDNKYQYTGNPSAMSNFQSADLAEAVQKKALPETSPIATKPLPINIDSLSDKVEKTVSEKTYEENRVAGNYVDAQAKEFFSGGKAVYDPNKITAEAFENLFGDNGLFQIMKQWMDSNKLIIVSKGLVVFDKAANVAGEIDLLLTDGKNFYIVDLKTGDATKWDKYNDPESFYYAKKEENTLQQAAYINLLNNMVGIKATAKIFPVQIEVEKETGKILKASKPTSSNALKAGKILIDLPVSPEMQAKIDEVIPPTNTPTVSSVPMSNSVTTLVTNAAAQSVSSSEYEEEGTVVAGKITFGNTKVAELEDKINKADLEALQLIELNFGLKDALNMSAEEVLQVQQMIDSRRSILTSGDTVVMSEISYSIGDQVYSENVIFAEKGKSKGEVFLKPFDSAVISKIDFDKSTITIKPFGKTTQMTIPMDDFNKMFKLKSDLTNKEEAPTETANTPEQQVFSKESTDVVSELLENKEGQQALQIEVGFGFKSVDATIEDLLDNLDC